MDRIGLLGGTFDPVHNGHLHLGGTVMKFCQMDSILFIPAAHPPHKRRASVCDIGHRLQMLRLAIGGIDRFSISEIELSRGTPSYTIDTIRQLQQQSGVDIDYHFILGFDAILEIETWYRWRELLFSANFIVAVRPGFSLERIEHLLERNDFHPDPRQEDCWVHPVRKNVVRFLMERILDVSSTEIRQKIEVNEPWHHLMPESVASYIDANKLYRRA